MITEMIAYHSTLTYIFLWILLIGLPIPFWTSSNPFAFRKVSFIYTMFFQTFISMVVFTGLIALAAGDLDFGVGVIVMVIVWVILMYFEIGKYIKIARTNMQDESIFRAMRVSFLKIQFSNIALVILMIMLMVLRDKGVISI